MWHAPVAPTPFVTKVPHGICLECPTSRRCPMTHLGGYVWHAPLYNYIVDDLTNSNIPTSSSPPKTRYVNLVHQACWISKIKLTRETAGRTSIKWVETKTMSRKTIILTRTGEDMTCDMPANDLVSFQRPLKHLPGITTEFRIIKIILFSIVITWSVPNDQFSSHVTEMRRGNSTLLVSVIAHSFFMMLKCVGK
jgi:hypothetical protein